MKPEMLWRDVESALEWHRKERLRERSGLDVLRRLSEEVGARHNLPAFIPPEPGSADIQFRNITREEAIEAVVPSHGRTQPNNEAGSLIAIAWENKKYLVDGSNRFNRWVLGRDQFPKPIIVIVPLARPAAGGTDL